MEVDHVYPRATFPHLELDEDNTQVLCGPCNRDKGASIDDYRGNPLLAERLARKAYAKELRRAEWRGIVGEFAREPVKHRRRWSAT